MFYLNESNKGDLSLLRKALLFADTCHFMRFDKQGDKYIYHPIIVALKCETEDEKIVALLHDVVEDCIDLEELKEQNFPDHILNAIEAITRQEDEDYFVYINRLSNNNIARAVKLHDLEDNLDETRGSISDSLRDRYKRAYDIIRSFDESQ